MKTKSYFNESNNQTKQSNRYNANTTIMLVHYNNSVMLCSYDQLSVTNSKYG